VSDSLIKFRKLLRELFQFDGVEFAHFARRHILFPQADYAACLGQILSV